MGNDIKDLMIDLDNIEEKNITTTIEKEISKIIESDIEISKKKQILKKYYDFLLRIIKKTSKEIDDLEKIQMENNNIANITLNYSNPNYDILPKINNLDYLASKINIANYITLINSFISDSDFDLLFDIIPSEDFTETINKIIAYYLSDKMTLKKLQLEDDTDIFKSEEEKLDFIMKNLFRLRDNVKKEIIINKLVYATTSGNNVIFLNDISAMPFEYYNDINQAFTSIIDGRFKNNKRLTKLGENIKRPICQVRYNQIRIFYKQLETDLYLIIGTVIKKIDCSPHYVSYINNISTISSSFYDNYINMTDKAREELLLKGDNITKEVFKILTKRR